ncbi:MAG: glycosyltransferase [Deltaproteobacteria bacterium]|nr:glycosyltransferase [Deltaproteobacteria bacterium]
MQAETIHSSSTKPLPHVTIVIPIYNEEGLLETAVVSLREALRERFAWPYELILAENGSMDATLPIARRLSEKFPEVRYISLGEPNYGKALKRGILESRGHYVICDEIDLCDVDFYSRALERLDFGYEMVVGSKLAPGAEDKRPLFRHLGSQVINALLRFTVGFKGTDTHGLKAFVRDRLLEVAADCLVDRDLFASELVIRAERRCIRICEIPVRVVEKRAPSINLIRRVPGVLKGLVKLSVAVRIRS